MFSSLLRELFYNSSSYPNKASNTKGNWSAFNYINPTGSICVVRRSILHWSIRYQRSIYRWINWSVESHGTLYLETLASGFQERSYSNQSVIPSNQIPTTAASREQWIIHPHWNLGGSVSPENPISKEARGNYRRSIYHNSFRIFILINSIIFAPSYCLFILVIGFGESLHRRFTMWNERLRANSVLMLQLPTILGPLELLLEVIW